MHVWLKNSNSSTSKLLVYQSKKSNWGVLKIARLEELVQQQTCSNSSQATSGEQQVNNKKSGGSGFKFFAFALTGFTVGLGYMALNPEPRREIESRVPQSQALFSYIDGLLSRETLADKSKVILTKQESSPKSIEPIFPTKSTPAPITKQAESKPVFTSPLKNVSAVQASSLAQKKEEKVVEKKPEIACEDWKRTVKKYDLKQEATVDAIEQRLHQLDSDIKSRVSQALTASVVAIESLDKYRGALRAALDDDISSDSSDKELQWRQVTNLFDTQASDVSEANEKFDSARQLVSDMDAFLAEAKSNEELVGQVKNLRATQNDLIDQFRRLQSEQNRLAETVIHANVLRTYTVERKQARSQFLKEIQSLQPEGMTKLNSDGDQLSNEEINSLLIHAHKRVLQLQKQLERLQLTQNQQIQAALDEQSKQNVAFLDKYSGDLRQLHRKEFEVEKDEMRAQEQQKADAELRKELQRQAAAHNNHLAQMLKIQQDELNALYEKKLLIETEKVRCDFHAQVSASVGRLKGIEQALESRANEELQANNAKQLWLAVQSLNETINTPPAGDSKEDRLVSIAKSIQTISQAAPDNKFIQNLLATLPSNSLKEGVWSEPALKERFFRLKEVCRRVALIDERGGSLFKYAISYLQSFFIVHAKIDAVNTTLDASLGDKVDLSKTFSILDYAQFYVENGQIEMALRLMQQLEGEPSRLARGWINETILLAEIKQTSRLLLAYISSVYIGTEFR